MLVYISNWMEWAKLVECSCCSPGWPDTKSSTCGPHTVSAYTGEGGRHIAWHARNGLWTPHVYLPGEDECPEIPDDLQHDWKIGDAYWWMHRRTDMKWRRYLYSESDEWDKDFPKTALYIPDHGSEPAFVRVANLIRSNHDW
jgi:hypothetical protein